MFKSIGFLPSKLCFLSFIAAGLAFIQKADAQQSKLVNVASGWANNTVNTVVFRKNALVTWKDTQFIAFYNQQHYVVLGKRKIGSEKWELKQTSFTGNTADAHNCISIMVDGEGYLHVSWDHHGSKLHYSRSVSPGSLTMLAPLSMTGIEESSVTYPEFYRLANGNLLFLYRSGASGKGNLVLNRYDIKTHQWNQLYSNLIDGEGRRNAYWQAFVDVKGIIHISWVWRESADVASNHDLCYARSTDGGITWEKSTGEKYTLPVTAATAEYICHISQKSELINQTSMYADENGEPYIATYWKEKNDSVPQYHFVYHQQKKWYVQSLSFRKTPFTLSGGGSKRIPIARPQIISWISSNSRNIGIVFRDEERGNKLSIAVFKTNFPKNILIKDITDFSIGSSEPLYDTELWKEQKKLNFFIQYTEQIDGEGKADIPPTPVQVLEWNYSH
ncbi:MAG: BNR repeat-containing protein [Bacteroidota bacterium]|nr:BNR repeat-containing protein [Bacteroidota bacterium]